MKNSRRLYRLCTLQRHKSSQGGVALIVALILLVVMTLVGLSGLRNVTLEERMTANTFDRSISFQAAEAALREGEALVQAQSALPAMQPAAGTACNAVTAVCGAPVAPLLEPWLDNATPWANAAPLNNGGIAITPQYMIEFLGNNFTCAPPGGVATCSRYRITARSNAGADRSVVILQSIFAPL